MAFRDTEVRIHEERICVAVEGAVKDWAAYEGEMVFGIPISEQVDEIVSFGDKMYSEEAKEVCQDVFVKIFRGINSFQNNCSLKTWIYRITLNTVLNEKRRWYQRLKDRFVGLDVIAQTKYDSIPDPALSLTMSDRCRSVSLALQKMRPDHRAILVMRDLEGLSYQEISDALGLALGTVKSRLARARQEMKDAIQDII